MKTKKEVKAKLAKKETVYQSRWDRKMIMRCLVKTLRGAAYKSPAFIQLEQRILMRSDEVGLDNVLLHCTANPDDEKGIILWMTEINKST